MQEQTTEIKTPSAFNTILEIGWLVIAMIIPLWVNFGTQRPFDPPKVFLFRTLIWFLTSLVCARYLLVPGRIRLHW